MEPPVEPDLMRPWSRNVWLYGLRIPFSLVFLGWITFAQAMSPSFSWSVYLLTILAAFFGLVIGAHFIDIATSVQKFSPYFEIPVRRMMAAGLSAVLTGALVGVYMAIQFQKPLFLLFVALEGTAAVAYPRERPRFAHSYTSFGLTWGTVPVLAAYYIQAGTLNLMAVSVSAFVGISVVMMHHLAVMTRESSDWRNAMYLLNLYRYSVYAIAFISFLGKIF
jgi:hypothetical protein